MFSTSTVDCQCSRHGYIVSAYPRFTHNTITGQLLGLNTRADRLLNQHVNYLITVCLAISPSAPNVDQIEKAILTHEFAPSSVL